MVMKKVEFYYENDDGKLVRATLDSDQYTFALHNCRDYNSLMEFIDTVAKWERI